MNKILIIVILSILLSACSTNNDIDQNLSIHFIDVGQGDSTLIITPDKKSILIDAGDNDNGIVVTRYLNKLNIKKLDFLIATHPDTDHIGGIDDIIYNFNVKAFIMPNKTHTTDSFKDILIAAKHKNIPIYEGFYGFNFALNQNTYCEILNPIKQYPDENNLWSIVLKITHNEKKILLMGDAYIENERDMLKSKINLDCDILKIGHHGSNSSTCEYFLKNATPDASIISCKYNNKYNHPSTDVLSLLKKHNIPIYRTDEQKNIVFYSDGFKIWTYKKPGTYNTY